MKRLLSLLILACALANTCQAQIGENRSDLAVGVNGGYLLNTVGFNPTIKQNFHGGTTFGLTVRYTCEKYFSCYCALQGEINYAQMGWNELIETSTDTYKRDINYLQIPLLARMAFGKERGGVQGFLILGPQLGLYLSEKECRGGEWSDYTLSLRPNHRVEQYDMKVEKKFEYGITGGLGMQVSTKSGHYFILEGRYFYGLSDLFGNSKKDPFGKSNNGAIIAKLSYLIDIKKSK